MEKSQLSLDVSFVLLSSYLAGGLKGDIKARTIDVLTTHVYRGRPSRLPTIIKFSLKVPFTHDLAIGNCKNYHCARFTNILQSR